MFFCKESPRKTLLYKLDEEIIRDVLVDLADITYNFSSTSIDFFSLENSFDILLAMNNNDDAIGIKYDTKEVDRSSIAYYDKENTKPFKKHINNQLIYFLKFKLKTLLQMSIKYIGENSVANAHGNLCVSKESLLPILWILRQDIMLTGNLHYCAFILW
jgi:hypothetical protein